MRIDYRELKQQIRLIDLLTRIGWKGTKGRGEQLRGPCPLPSCCRQVTNRNGHGDSVFSINTTKSIYRCFRCGSAGNSLDFWLNYRAITLHQAAVELSHLSKTSNSTHS